MNIGSKIRTIRLRKKLTIAQMCEGTGLSKGFISNVENNNTSPSINTLQIIANFLNIPLPYLLLEKDQHMSVIRKNEREYTINKKRDLKIEHLASQGGLSMRLVEFPPGASTAEENAHEGEECHLVLRGKILAKQGEDSYILEEGDTFSWSASVPHYVENIGDEVASVLISVYAVK
ncbi:helix-turn-helix domain-containing protein [Heyndrickxia ginsengihumi]|uniref:Cupin domain-containing protein n=1 Tax=Heyndrickxia ginsengihumi TaxID=363870 RepID=A0A0A6VA77_9BACI|nr:cupin domain-containing protein [Heyndrickxia ginsengihumi]KHD85130.1 DNA-binding protein [Heyndrickxia ginsengihumi]MBE6183566.1 cupin domain-containing protein [Bacillus sp. (in: firmicutes)]MCM3024542.1 cupin domain-containing protein [Heyndrickxia ginsengihumi]NEY20150.1 cupin domain-containing protein [Heyndrickxia ginsengihumi]